MLMSYKKAVEIYGEDKLVKLLNTKQILKYIKHGAKPVAYISGYEDKDVFIFLKSDTSELYTKWIEHELK